MSQVISFSGYTPPARFDHVAWTEAQVEEAATAAGTWAVIDTLALSPLDTDPSTPQARSFTTTEASDAQNLWYRVTFRDADGNASQPTDPVQNVAPTTPFATAEDFAARMGLELTSDEESRATALLGIASGMIRQETRQTISLVEADVLTRPGSSSDRIRLKERPVVSIDAVHLTPPGGSQELVDAASYYLDGDELVRLSYRVLSPELTFGMGQRGWIGPAWTLAITYTHGFEEVPPLVKGICLEMVVRAWTNPASVAQESIGNVSTLYYYAPSRPTGLLMADTEIKALNDLLRRQSGTVTLR